MSNPAECRDCHGEGEMRWNPSPHPAWETSTTCLTCDGTGEVPHMNIHENQKETT